MYESGVSDAQVTAALDGLSGADLAVALADLVASPAAERLSAFARVEVLAGFERVARWAQAGKLSVLGTLGDARGVADSRDGALLLGSEVSLALGVSRQAADGLVLDAHAMRTRVPTVLTALEQGRVCERGAHAIVAETAVLGAEGAARVASAVLERPGVRTVPRLRALAKAAVLRIDPATAEQREQRAVKDRFVRADHRVEDGMVSWSGWLPATDSIRIFDRLRVLGDASKVPGDHRSAEARRADVLCDLLLGRPVSTAAGDVVDTVNPAGKRVWRSDVVVEASTLQGRDEHPGHVPSWGPVTAGTARRISAGHTGAVDRPPRQPVTAPRMSQPAGGAGVSGVGGEAAPAPCEQERSTPTAVGAPYPMADAEAPTERVGPASEGPHEPAAQVNGSDRKAPENDAGEPPGTGAGEALGTGDGEPPEIGDGEAPGTDRGEAPETGDGEAPETDAQWRRILTDPVTGLVTDYGTTRYRPPQALADLIRARDGRCYEPSCTVTAWRADLDHIRPSPAGPSPHPDDDGTTSAGNLAPACRRHHRTKQAPGWAVHADPDRPGTYTWTTPTGHTHVRHAEPPLPWYGHPALEPPQPASGRDQHHHGHHEQPVPAGAGVRPRLETPVERSRLDRLAARARARGVLDLPATPEAPPF